MRFAQSYFDLDNLLTAFIPYITANMIRLGLTQTDIDTFTAPKTEWDATFALYLDATTQTQSVRLRTSNAAAVMYALVHGIQQLLRANPAVELTAEDYTVLDIIVPTPRRERVPVPIVVPEINIRATAPRWVEVSFNDTDIGKENVRGLPIDVHAVEYDIAITAPGDTTPPDDSMYIRHGTSNRSIGRIAFTNENNGMNGWIKAAYANPRSELGPFSTPIRFNII